LSTHIIFIYGDFDDLESIEFFCNEIVSQSTTISDINYIIQNVKNIIIFFTSEIEKDELNKEISNLLNIYQVEYYFMFKLEDMKTYKFPDKFEEKIFKSKNQKNVKKNYNIDDILDKISKYGLNGISDDEKNFLDNLQF